LQACLGKLCLGACIYYLWQQGNALVHNNNLRTKEDIVKQIKREVCTRVLAKGTFKNLKKHISLVLRWNLQKLL
jgi:hypothetical protein